MEVKLVPYGDGAALVLDKEMLEKMHTDPEATVQVVIGEGSLLATSTQDEARRAAFRASMEEMHERYSNVFKRLAEGA